MVALTLPVMGLNVLLHELEGVEYAQNSFSAVDGFELLALWIFLYTFDSCAHGW